VVEQNWQVVLDRENIQVLSQSYKAAQASYNHDKRALQLGALSPLDIYQSEAEVATRKISVIRARHPLKQDDDQLRTTLGADLDPAYATLDLDLIEPPKTPEPLLTVNTEKAVTQALAKRPDSACAGGVEPGASAGELPASRGSCEARHRSAA